MKRAVIIWGASGHAKVVADIFRQGSAYEIAGFVDDINPSRKGESFCGSIVVGGGAELRAVRESGISALIVGFGDCVMRLDKARSAEAMGFELISAIHPQSIIGADVEVGAGTVVVAGAVINCGARIGKNVIINTSSSIDHDCVLQDGVHIGPGAHLAGTVSVGEATFIGIGSVVRERTRIGAHCVIGAGSVVVSDILDGMLAFGVPAAVKGKTNA